MLTTLFKSLFGERKPNERDWLERVVRLQQSGQYDEAARMCRLRLAREPSDVHALQALGAATLAQGRTDEGLSHLRRAASLIDAPASAHLTLGRVCASAGRLDEAVEHYREALAADPDGDTAAAELAALLKARGLYDELEDCCRAALAHFGDSLERRHMLANTLFEQGRVAESIDELRACLALEPNAPAVHSDLLRALNYAEDLDPQALFEAHREWAFRHETPVLANAAPRRARAEPAKRVRVGYVSPHFRKHAVTFFLESVLEHHDRNAFDVLLYADVARPDAYSNRLIAHGAQWRSTVGLDDEALARMVRDDETDVLVDLSGHTPGHRLLAFARRPAPVQVTWNGYPNTTGMQSIDYRVTDGRCDPPGTTEALHTERLVRLPDIYMSWRPPREAPDPGMPPLCASGTVTFGSFNSCYKITRTMVGIWSRVLDRVRGSRLMLLAVPEGRAEARVRRLFESAGIASDRIVIRPRVTHEQFLEAHRSVDIALDTFPYHGTTTTCFSLWMGVPVVVLYGATHVSRVGLSLLSCMGLGHLACSSPEDYVSAAANLAREPGALAGLRAELRQRMLRSPLADGAACATALEQAYREMHLGALRG